MDTRNRIARTVVAACTAVVLLGGTAAGQRCYLYTTQTVAGGALDLDLFILNTSTPFVPGTSSFVLPYDTLQLSAPVLVPEADGPWSAANDPDYAALSSLDHRGEGYVDLVVSFTGGGDNTGVQVTAVPVRIGRLRFTVADSTAALRSWRAIGSVTQVTALANPGVDLTYREVTDSCAFHVLDLKAYLQGAYDADTMRTTLRAHGYVPSAQPYGVAPWSYGGAEYAAVLPADIVDWVLIELRSGTDASTRIASQAAYLHSNGIISTADSVPFLGFRGIASGSYYVVVRHRNHLAAMSAVPVAIGALRAGYDLTTGAGKYYGGVAVALGGGVYGLYGGDADANGQITSTDFNVFNPRFTAAAKGYQAADWNLDGQVTSVDFNLFNPNFTKAQKTHVP